MKRAGRDRRSLLVAMCADVALLGTEVIVDVGADHGHVAHALGAIATERALHRRGRKDVPWVIGDGLRPFRHVDVAIIAGMGADTIAGILTRGPRPRVAAVLHAPDSPGRLRSWLGVNGWRIDAEGLAREAGRFAEVMRVVPGEEPATGLTLWFGPRLLDGDDPLRAEHFGQLLGHYRGLADRTAHLADADRADPVHANFAAKAAFLASMA